MVIPPHKGQVGRHRATKQSSWIYGYVCALKDLTPIIDTFHAYRLAQTAWLKYQQENQC